MTNTAALLLVALLAVIPRIPQPIRDRVAAHRDAIVAVAATAEREYGVPAGLMLVVGLLESHWGLHDGEGYRPGHLGDWGAPASATQRHVAGPPARAARILAHSLTECGGPRWRMPGWLPAVRRFRSGLCSREHAGRGYSARYALELTRRAYARAGVALPDGLVAR